MHSFLKSIGFSSITKKKELQKILNTIIEKPDNMSCVQIDEETNFAVATKYFSNDIGISVCGELNEDGVLEMEYYFPFLTSPYPSSNAPCQIKKQGEKEAYAGSCDDYRLGITLIFYVINFMQGKELYSRSGIQPTTQDIFLSGLAEDGKILMEIAKTEEQKEASKSHFLKRSQMIEAAKNGDTEAMEQLTMEEVNIFNHFNKKKKKKDLYSLIDSFFMPYGVECDQYSIMGDILDMKEFINPITNEEVYIFLLDCNDILLKVAINKDNLLGQPTIGRRFKGKIWLQGCLDFSS